MTQKSLKQNAFFNFAKALANFAFPLITFPYVSRILMPDGIGRINFVNSVVEYFVLIAELGISSYAAREAAKIRDDKKKLNEFCRDIFCLNLISTAVAFILLIVAMLAVPKFNSYRPLFVICSAKILFSSTGMNWLFTAFEEFKYITTRSIVFQILCLVFLFIFVRTPDDWLLYGAIGVFSYVGPNILNLFYSRKFVNLFVHTRIHFAKHLKPVLIFLGTDCATKLHTTIDAVILGFMMSDFAVGYYSAANKIYKIVCLVISTTLSTFMPRSSYYLEKGKINEYHKMTQKCANLTVFFVLPAATGLLLLSEPLLVLFCGTQYLPAVNTMRILCPIVFINGIGTFMNQVVIIPQRKERIVLVAQIVGGILNITLNMALIPIWGVFGAAFATLIVEFTIEAIKFAQCAKSIVNRNVLANFAKSLVATAVMSPIVILIMQRTDTYAGKIIFSTMSGFFVYASLTALLRHETTCAVFGTMQKLLHKYKP